MQNQRLQTDTLPLSTVLRQPAPERQEEPEAVHTPAVQRDLTAQLACRVGDASCAGAYADKLDRATVQPQRDSLLRLQRDYGNRFVQRVVDLSRREEDGSGVSPEVEQGIRAARGGGQGLDRGVRAQMEPAFGADFGGVRVHSDARADGLNRSLSARAFTTGQDIFFKQGEYNPGTSNGRELLAHELTHVVQQNGKVVQAKLSLGRPGDRYEQEADSVARAVMQREQQPVQKDKDGESVRRQETPEEDEEGAIQEKMDDGALQRQPEEEDELQPKTENGWAQRQVEEEEEEPAV